MSEMQRIGAETQNIGDVQALMDAFCPMHVILDASGHIVHVGATLQKLRAPQAQSRAPPQKLPQ